METTALARQAMERLLAGNRQFAAQFDGLEPGERARTLSSAEPYAVVLGCSDSRVPPEVVLGEDLGRLFVVRVAGNVAGSDEIGSIEYAVARWACPIVLVLGHTQCGAVGAVLDRAGTAAEPGPDLAGLAQLSTLLVSVRSNVAMGSFVPAGSGQAPGDPWAAAVMANVRRTVDTLRERSGFLRGRAAEGSLRIVGAVYEVETGLVRPLDAPRPAFEAAGVTAPGAARET